MSEKRDPYDGQPYYCNACGLSIYLCECSERELESEASAQLRQRRRRPMTTTQTRGDEGL